MFDSGIRKEGDLIELATGVDGVTKSGAWLNYDKVRLGQGRENAKQFLRDNPKLFKEIRAKVLAAKMEDEAARDKGGRKAAAKTPRTPATRKKGR